MTPPTITKTANQLLSTMKPSDFAQVAKHLTRVKLRPKGLLRVQAVLRLIEDH